MPPESRTRTMHRAIPASASKSWVLCLPRMGGLASAVLAIFLALGASALGQSVRPGAPLPTAGPPTPAASPIVATPAPTTTPPQIVPSPTSVPVPFTVTAHRLTYYSDRDMVTGEDAVSIKLADG